MEEISKGEIGRNEGLPGEEAKDKEKCHEKVCTKTHPILPNPARRTIFIQHFRV